MGIGFQITMPLATGLRVAFFEPHQPPTFPTAPNVIRALIKTSPNFVMVPSSIIKEWAQSKSDIEQLKKLDAVMYGGSPMTEEIGNYLVDNGVKLLVYNKLRKITFTNKFPIDPINMEQLKQDMSLHSLLNPTKTGNI